MTGHTPWSELRAKAIKTPEQEQRVSELRRELRHADRVAQIREARNVTQASLAAQLGITQSGVSKLESQDDLYLSTLGRYVAGMGGRLEVRAVFDDEVIEMPIIDGTAA